MLHTLTTSPPSVSIFYESNLAVGLSRSYRRTVSGTIGGASLMASLLTGFLVPQRGTNSLYHVKVVPVDSQSEVPNIPDKTGENPNRPHGPRNTASLYGYLRRLPGEIWERTCQFFDSRKVANMQTADSLDAGDHQPEGSGACPELAHVNVDIQTNSPGTLQNQDQEPGPVVGYQRPNAWS